MKKTAPHIAEIIGKLRSAGHESYVVGGAVRDFLLDRTPKDYDVSTSAPPEIIRKVLGKGQTRVIGRRFRLVHYYHPGGTVEISTFRKAPPKQPPPGFQPPKHSQSAPKNMILHDNEFGTAEEDAWRRDFTVNAIFYNPLDNQVTDFTGQGVDDLKNGVVRAIGDPKLRFEEDPVRILRALKLVGQYGFKLCPDTEKALYLSMDLIRHAPNARLSLELEKIFKNLWSRQILDAFHSHGFMRYFLPFLHNEWDSPEIARAKLILDEKNRRAAAGLYRNSASVSAAAIALPFVSSRLRAGPDGLWENHEDAFLKTKHTLTHVFHPRQLMGKILDSAERMILMQPALAHERNCGKLLRRPAYPQARELMVIQNTLFWKNPELEEIWPQVWGRRHRHPGDGRRGRRGGPRDDSPESREPGHEESA